MKGVRESVVKLREAQEMVYLSWKLKRVVVIVIIFTLPEYKRANYHIATIMKHNT
jgi:uncharacterized membrane protein YccF (DUF307 family)